MSDWIIKPNLAQPAEIEYAVSLLSNPQWHKTQKVDGVRMILQVHDGKVYGINRKGSLMVIPGNIGKAFQHFDGEWCFDGEVLHNRYYIFDMPRALDVVDIDMPHKYRRATLEDLFPKLDMPDFIQLLPSYTAAEESITMAQKLLESNREGVVLKRGDAPYSPGKRTDNVLKLKFVKDIDAIVIDTNVDGKYNMALGLVKEDGKLQEIAHVSALTGDGMCEIGQVVTVTFLYVSDDNHLVQPTKPRLRTDKTPQECVWGQLEHFKVNKEILL